MMTGPLRRTTAALALAIVATGCFRYEDVGALPRTTRLPPELRVTTYRGAVTVLSTSEMVADTIIGYRSGSRDRVVIPLAHVDLLEVKRFSMMDSILFAAIATALFAYLLNSIRGGIFGTPDPVAAAPRR